MGKYRTSIKFPKLMGLNTYRWVFVLDVTRGNGSIGKLTIFKSFYPPFKTLRGKGEGWSFSSNHCTNYRSAFAIYALFHLPIIVILA